MKYVFLIFISVCLTFISPAYAEPPDELEGMKKIKQWTDYENKHDEMPSFIWGYHDRADRVGIYIEFAGGLTGSATYRDLIKTDIWNKEHGIKLPGVSPEKVTGFFAADVNSPLHFLRNVPVHCNANPNITYCLPMAWSTLTMPFSINFDLDYRNVNGSHFRASQQGWISVVIAVYAGSERYVLNVER